ncbi:MAG: acyl-CoA dehydrogenase family protein [Phaeodactylibacter sp.]|uniref:acyl-CoA dehydrogenase family protein n=1 Tax=Phaeodactylibacter sp. TaxID=1940289 RepID=UPI0032EDD0B4
MYAFAPSEQQLALKRSTAEFVQQELCPLITAGGTQFPAEAWQKAGMLRLQGLAIPEIYGGRGLDALQVFLVLETLGYHCEDNGFNFAISAHLLACAVPIGLFGQESIKAEYLPLLSDGRLIAANAMTEPASGSNAFQMQTLAEPAPDGSFVLQGNKCFSSNAPVADVLVVYAANDPERAHMGGITAFLADRAIHPFTTGPAIEKAGLHTCPLGDVFFDQVTIQNKFVIGKTGRGALIFNRSMEWERACLGATHVGNMQRLLDKAIQLMKQYGKDTFGDAARQELAYWQAQLDAVRFMGYAQAWQLNQKKANPRGGSSSKLLISELYKKMTIGLCRLLGEKQYLDQDFSRSQADAVSSTLYSGTSEIQKQIIAQAIGL